MDPQEQALTDHYLALLAKTGEDFEWPGIPFHPYHDGNEHVEFNEDGSWTTMVTDRGHESQHQRFTDIHELMFGLCARATWMAAQASVDEPNLHAHEFYDRTAKKQAELLRRIDPKWAQRTSLGHAEWRSMRDRIDADSAKADRLGRLGVLIDYGLGAAIVLAALLISYFLA